MNLKAFTVYDSKAQAYLPPFFLTAEGLASRSYADCINSESHQFAKNPGDYTLFIIGTFDDSSGSLEACTPISFGNGLEFVKPTLQMPLPIDDRPLDGNSQGQKNETKLRDDSPVQPGTIS